MYYWPTTRRVGQSKVEDWLFEVCEDAIPDDYRISGRNPRLELVMTPALVVDRGTTREGRMALLAAESILVLAWTKTFGFRSDTIAWDRWDFEEVARGMWARKYYMVQPVDGYGNGPHFMFHGRDEADALRDYFANG